MSPSYTPHIHTCHLLNSQEQTLQWRASELYNIEKQNRAGLRDPTGDVLLKLKTQLIALDLTCIYIRYFSNNNWFSTITDKEVNLPKVINISGLS